METIYTITGKVIKGKKIGRQLGFPTANLALDNDIPLSYGVYITSISIDSTGEKLKSVVNVGVHPCFPDGPATIEAYILDQDIDLYGKDITIYFHKKLREEAVFEEKKDLIAQIKKDVEDTRQYFI